VQPSCIVFKFDDCNGDMASGGRDRNFWWILLLLFRVSCSYRVQCCVTRLQGRPCLLRDLAVIGGLPSPCPCPRVATHPAPSCLIWIQPNEKLVSLSSWAAWSERSEVTRSNRSSGVESARGGADILHIGEGGDVKILYTWCHLFWPYLIRVKPKVSVTRHAGAGLLTYD